MRYIGPGLLITVGFIDPGNWASNLAAGADYGYVLLWMVTLSTIMLILLQVMEKPFRRREILSARRERFWDGIGESLIIPSVSARAWELLSVSPVL